MTDMPPPHDWHAPIIGAICMAYERFGPVTYVEVGIDRGHTLEYVSRCRIDHAYAVDITLANIEHELPDLVNLYEMSSDNFFTLCMQSAIKPQVIFIDGDHHANQVMKDLANSLEILAPNGIIIMHDTLPLEQRWMDRYCEDAYTVVIDAMQGVWGNQQVFTIPIFPGLTLVTGPYRPLTSEID